jgi:hypothetical protein
MLGRSAYLFFALLPAGYYASLVLRTSSAADRRQVLDAATIEADVIRTYTSQECHVFTINGVADTDAVDVVRRILYAMAMHGGDNSYGYVQGMNYLAANLLGVTGDEELSFWLAVSIAEVLLPRYFAQQLPQLQVDSKAFRSLVCALLLTFTHDLLLFVSEFCFVF